MRRRLAGWEASWWLPAPAGALAVARLRRHASDAGGAIHRPTKLHHDVGKRPFLFRTYSYCRRSSFSLFVPPRCGRANGVPRGAVQQPGCLSAESCSSDLPLFWFATSPHRDHLRQHPHFPHREGKCEARAGAAALTAARHEQHQLPRGAHTSDGLAQGLCGPSKRLERRTQPHFVAVRTDPRKAATAAAAAAADSHDALSSRGTPAAGVARRARCRGVSAIITRQGAEAFCATRRAGLRGFRPAARPQRPAGRERRLPLASAQHLARRAGPRRGGL
jgi:hypothetical protein